ncbi:MAG: Type 1 glutamine amidotransferase-like domain-containing protein [Candidatus Liptonbacteria bacterium]|nr:Type 1 glutamine amidotransferase-like domain-containing protein [Candidatus Liptonbacteria bacterium]
MRKLLLASDGGFLIKEGYAVLGVPKEKAHIAYITDASKGESNHEYLELHKGAMAEAGYRFTEMDVEGRSAEELRRMFAGKTVLHVEGGNSFYLLKAVRASGFEEVVREILAQGVPYVGTSAGAYLACPTIEVSTWGPKKKDHYGVTDFRALNLVPFLVRAHYKDELADLIREKARHASCPVRILRDGQGILVEGDSYRFVGTGEEVFL